MNKHIVFTDLDGTLLDAETYSYEAAGKALALLDSLAIPLIICSSKTKAEIELIRAQLGNRHPFISENGGGIFIPRGYFPFDYGHPVEVEGDYEVMRLGAPYEALRGALARLRAEGYEVKGFGDMTVAEVAQLTALPPREAMLARERHFDEPFVFEGEPPREQALRASVEALGYRLTKGRVFHIMGDSDKGRAVAILIDMLKRLHPGALSVALGDSPNDVPMLNTVDIPILVAKPGGGYDEEVVAHVPGVTLAPGVGPIGWRLAILQLLR